MVCRFHLALRERNKPSNMASSLHLSIKSSFHDVAERVHNYVVDEFGDSHMNPSAGTVTPVEETEGHQNTRLTTDAGIERHEFPWTTGAIGDTRTSDPVAFGEQLPSSCCHIYVEECCRIWNCGCLTNSNFNPAK